MSFDDNDVPEGIDIEDNSWQPQDEEAKMEEVSFKEFNKPRPDKVEEKVEETVKVVKDEFEELKQQLRDEQLNEYANPDKPYVSIKIPTGQKVGDECIIKFGGEVPKAQVAVSQKIEWKKRDKYDKTAKPELIALSFILDEHKSVGDKLLKEVSFMWEDIGIVGGKKRNLLKAGEYLVEVRVWNTNAGEETNAKRLVTIQ